MLSAAARHCLLPLPIAGSAYSAGVFLQRKGVAGYILDLRDNPGGLVKSGLDIARMLLDGHPTVFSIVGRAGEAEQKVRVCLVCMHVHVCACASCAWRVQGVVGTAPTCVQGRNRHYALNVMHAT